MLKLLFIFISFILTIHAEETHHMTCDGLSDCYVVGDKAIVYFNKEGLNMEICGEGSVYQNVLIEGLYKETLKQKRSTVENLFICKGINHIDYEFLSGLPVLKTVEIEEGNENFVIEEQTLYSKKKGISLFQQQLKL